MKMAELTWLAMRIAGLILLAMKIAMLNGCLSAQVAIAH